MSRVRSPSPAPSIYVKPSLIILTAHLARYNFEAAKKSSRIKIQETPHVQKQLPHCFVREDSVSSLDVTNAPPTGRIFFYLTMRNLEIDLCSRHLRHAVRVAETQAARNFPA